MATLPAPVVLPAFRSVFAVPFTPTRSATKAGIVGAVRVHLERVTTPIAELLDLIFPFSVLTKVIFHIVCATARRVAKIIVRLVDTPLRQIQRGPAVGTVDTRHTVTKGFRLKNLSIHKLAQHLRRLNGCFIGGLAALIGIETFLTLGP